MAEGLRACPEQRVTCATTQTCSLTCGEASTWVKTTCAEDARASACVDSFDEQRAYGCTLGCTRAVQLTDGARSEIDLDSR